MFGTGHQFGKNDVPFFVGSIDGLVMGFQDEVTTVTDSTESMKKLFPIDGAIAGEQMLIVLAVVILHVQRKRRMF